MLIYGHVREEAIQRNLEFARAFMTCLLILSLKPFLKAGAIIIPALPTKKVRLPEETEVSHCGRQFRGWQFISFHGLLAHWLSRAGHTMPGSWDLSSFSSASSVPTTACQMGKELPLLINRWGEKPRKRWPAQGPTAHKWQGWHPTLGLLILPHSVIIYYANWRTPTPDLSHSSLVVTVFTSTSPAFAKAVWIRGLSPLLSLTLPPKSTYLGARQRCVCAGCILYIYTFILISPHSSTMKDTWFLLYDLQRRKVRL